MPASVEIRQLLLARVLRVAHEQVRRRGQGVARERVAVRADREAADVARTGQVADLAGLHVDREQRMLAVGVAGRIQGAAVGRELQRAGRTIPVRGDVAGGAGGQVTRFDLEAVGFEGRAAHRQVIKRLAVAREQRIAVPGLIGIGQVHRRQRTVGRRREQIEVGAPGFGLAGDARREHQRLAIRREGVFGLVAEGLGRHVAVDALADPGRRGFGLAVGAEVGDEELAAATVHPGIPVADEELVEHDAGGLLRGAFIETLPGAVERVAVGEDFQRDGDLTAVRRQLEGADVERIVGDLHRLAAGERQLPDLHRTRTRAQEIDRLAVAGPARTDRGRTLRGEPARRGRAIGRHQPQALQALVRGVVGFAQLEGELAAIRRQARIGDAIEVDEIVDVEAARLGERRTRREQRKRAEGEHTHGTTPVRAGPAS
jgi:hypothetical protein